MTSLSEHLPNSARCENRESADGKTRCASVERVSPRKRSLSGGQLPLRKQGVLSAESNGGPTPVRGRAQRSPGIAETGNRRERGVQEHVKKQDDWDLREYGADPEGGHEDRKKVPNIDVDERASMQGLRSHGGSGSLHGRERTARHANNRHRDGERRGNFKEHRRSGRVVHDGQNDGRYAAVSFRRFWKEMIMVEGRLDIFSSAGAGPSPMSWTWRKF